MIFHCSLCTEPVTFGGKSQDLSSLSSIPFRFLLLILEEMEGKKGREILHSIHEKVTKSLNLNIVVDNWTQNRYWYYLSLFRFISKCAVLALILCIFTIGILFRHISQKGNHSHERTLQSIFCS